MLTAQIHAVSDLQISEGNVFTINGKFTFYMNSEKRKVGKLLTVRGENPGMFNFSINSHWTGASTNQFIDGVVQATSMEPFLFPVGVNSEYRPIGVGRAVQARASFVDEISVKFRETGVSENTIVKLVDKGYWLLSAEAPTQITLTWNEQSKLNKSLGDDLSQLTVIGWKNGQWNVIESSIDIQSINTGLSALQPSTHFSSIEKGSITTTDKINPNEYEALALGLQVTTKNVLEPTISIFPNPIMEGVPISIDYNLPQMSGGTLKIFYENGTQLAKQQLSDSSGLVHLSSITAVSGTYLVSLELPNGKTISEKFIVAAKK